MTFKEFYYYSLHVEESEEREWMRQSVMMSFQANMNAPKGKRFTPDDFNPFSGKTKTDDTPDTSQDVTALRDRIAARNKKFNKSAKRK